MDILALTMCVVCTLVANVAFAQNTRIASFQDAKRHLAVIFAEHPVTISSSCAYVGKLVDYDACAYVPARPGVRAQRIEREHVVPAEAFGRAFAAWRDGHPACVNPEAGRFAAATALPKSILSTGASRLICTTSIPKLAN